MLDHSGDPYRVGVPIAWGPCRVASLMHWDPVDWVPHRWDLS